MPSAGTSRWLVLLAALVFLAAPLRAHEGQERRQIIVSVGPDGLEVLVFWELPSGALARELRGAIDQDGSGAIDRPHEELARAQLLVPRATAGWRVEVSGESVSFVLEGIDLSDGPGDGARRGFVGTVLLSAPLPLVAGEVDGAELSVRVVVDAETVPVRAELQVLAPFVLAHSLIPPAADAPVVGPVDVLPHVPLEVVIRGTGGRPPELAPTPGSGGP